MIAFFSNRPQILFFGISIPIFFIYFAFYSFFVNRIGIQFNVKLSLLLQAICAGTMIFIFSFQHIQNMLTQESFEDKNSTEQNFFSLNFAFTVIVATIAITVIHLFYTASYIDFSGQRSGANIVSLFYIATVGGSIIGILANWFILSILSYLLATALGCTQRFQFFLSLIGIAQLGIFLAGFGSLLFSLFTLNSYIPISNFALIMGSSPERSIIGKFGEFLMLFIVSYSLVIRERIATTRAVFIAFLPTLVIGIISEFLKFIYEYL